VVMPTTAHNLVAGAVVAGTAGATYTTRLHPLWIFAAAAVLGLAGVL